MKSNDSGVIKLSVIKRLMAKAGANVRLANISDAPYIVELYDAQVQEMLKNGIRQWDEEYTEAYNVDFVEERIRSPYSRVYVRDSIDNNQIDAVVFYEDAVLKDSSSTIRSFDLFDLDANGYVYCSHLAKKPGAPNTLGFLAKTAFDEYQNGTCKLRLTCVDNESVNLVKFYKQLGFKHVGTIELDDSGKYNLSWLENESLFEAELQQ